MPFVGLCVIACKSSCRCFKTVASRHHLNRLRGMEASQTLRRCALVFIFSKDGCAERKLDITGFPSERIYANPSRSLYDKLGMVRNLDFAPSDEPRKTYLKHGNFVNAMLSIWVSR